MKNLFGLFVLTISALTIINTLNAQWVQQNSGTNETLSDVVALNTMTAIAVGLSGSILRTSDAGTTWINVAESIAFVETWKSVSFYNATIGSIVGYPGSIVTTTNGGNNWVLHTIPNAQICFSVLQIWPGNIYVGADSGWIYHSVDNGTTWTSEKISTWPIVSLFEWRGTYIFGSPLYALTPYSLCSKETFPYIPWSETILPDFQPFNSAAYNGEFCNGGGAGFIVGVQGDKRPDPTILRKSMGDTTWRKVPTGIIRDGVLLGVSAPSANVIYACGSGGMMFKSTNGGDTWTNTTVPTTRTLHAIYLYNETHGFAVGDSGTILYTANGGHSPVNTPPQPFHLQRPTNGDTMTVPRSITFMWQKAIDMDSDSVGYSLFISSDNGATWGVHGSTTDTMLQVHSPAQTPGPYFWTVKATDGEFTTPSLDVFMFTIKSSTNAEENSAPSTFAVYQNYPNPFNPATRISFSLPSRSFTSLKVYDLIGREIATLVYEELPLGNHSRQWDAKDSPNGIYLYRLQAGIYSATKKLVLLR